MTGYVPLRSSRVRDMSRWSGVLVVSLMSTQVLAQDWRDSLQIHGFVSQGYVKTSANHWYGDSDRGSWDLREIGVNFSSQPMPRLQLSGQVLSRTAGQMDTGTPALDYGLLDWTVWTQDTGRAGIRLGRVKNPLGFYNETRDVAFTRPGIFMPQAIYFDRVHNLILSADGLQLYGEGQLGAGVVSLQLGAGYPPLDDNPEYVFLGLNWAGELKHPEPLWVGRLGYEFDSHLRLALSGIMGEVAFTRGVGDPEPPVLNSGSVNYRLGIVSLQYNLERWSLTAEYLTQLVDWRDMGRLLPDRNPGEGYYLQVDYRFSIPVEAFLRHGVYYLNTDDKDGRQGEAQRGVAAHTQFAKDWTLGLRWDPDPAWMVRAEYQRVDGTAWLSYRDIPSGRERDWDMFALEVSFKF